MKNLGYMRLASFVLKLPVDLQQFCRCHCSKLSFKKNFNCVLWWMKISQKFTGLYVVLDNDLRYRTLLQSVNTCRNFSEKTEVNVQTIYVLPIGIQFWQFLAIRSKFFSAVYIELIQINGALAKLKQHLCNLICLRDIYLPISSEGEFPSQAIALEKKILVARFTAIFFEKLKLNFCTMEWPQTWYFGSTLYFVPGQQIMRYHFDISAF